MFVRCFLNFFNVLWKREKFLINILNINIQNVLDVKFLTSNAPLAHLTPSLKIIIHRALECLWHMLSLEITATSKRKIERNRSIPKGMSREISLLFRSLHAFALLRSCSIGLVKLKTFATRQTWDGLTCSFLSAKKVKACMIERHVITTPRSLASLPERLT